MKFLNIKHLLLLLLAASLLVVSCKKDDDDPQPTNQNPNPTDTTGQGARKPTITLGSRTTPTSSPILPGSTITIAFTAKKGTQGKNIDTLLVEYSMNDGAFTTVAPYPAKGLNVAEYTRNLTFTAKSTGTQKEAYRLTITDLDGNKATQTLTYTIGADTTAGELDFYGEIELDNEYAFFSTQTWEMFEATAAEDEKAIIDISFFYSATSGNNLASPAARNSSSLYGDFAITWGTVSTEFRTTNLTSAQYDAIETAAEVTQAFNAGVPAEVTGGNAPGSRITGVSADGKGGQFVVGKVLAFKSSIDNKIGLIRIDQVAADENGTASFSITKQK